MNSPAATQRIVISGGPGFGKSTLLAELGRRGHACRAEVSRAIIQEQVAAGGDLFPWVNLQGFADECFRRMTAQLAEPATGRWVFFDRAIPDIIGYLRLRGLPVEPRLCAAARGAYASPVFVAPPWAEIYRNDPERPQSYATAVAVHGEIVQAYREGGFEVVELPRGPVAARADWLLARLAAETKGRAWAA